MRYNSILKKHGLCQYVSSATRRAWLGNRLTSTCIDHIISHDGSSGDIIISDVKTFQGLADHDVVQFSLQLNTPCEPFTEKFITFRSLKRYTKEKLLADLAQ